MKILAIESSCDETGASIAEPCGRGVKILADVKASSAEIHNKYGGIVPEVAAREQVKVMVPVIKEAVEKAGVNKDLIEAVAVSSGPGLMGSLLMGVETAKSLAWAWEKDLISVNHMAAHMLANWIVEDEGDEVPELPAVGLVVSGGHTDLIEMKAINKWKWIGGTRDDAAGECLDKAARALGLGYPGGPAIQRAAEEATGKWKNKLPRPMMNEDNLEMSFSGLKTAVVREVEEAGELNEEETRQLAKEVNEAVVDILVDKTMKAVNKTGVGNVIVAGGVAASKLLRERMEQECETRGVILNFPEMKYCTDNGAMIGAAGIMRGEMVDIEKLEANPGLETV